MEHFSPTHFKVQCLEKRVTSMYVLSLRILIWCRATKLISTFDAPMKKINELLVFNSDQFPISITYRINPTTYCIQGHRANNNTKKDCDSSC